MGGEAEEIDRQRVKRQRLVWSQLHGIGVKQHTGAAAQMADPFDRLNGAHLALPTDHRHQPGGTGQQLVQCLKVDQTRWVHRQGLNLPAAPLQLSSCGTDRRVLDSRNQQTAWLEGAGDALQSQMHRFGAP